MEESLNRNMYFFFFLLNLKVISILMPLEMCRIKEMKKCWICKTYKTCYVQEFNFCIATSIRGRI